MKHLKLLIALFVFAVGAFAQSVPAFGITQGLVPATQRRCVDSVNVGSVYTQIANGAQAYVCLQTGAASLGQGAYGWVPIPSAIATSCGSSASCAAPSNFSTMLKVVTGTIAFSAATTASVTGITPAFTAATSYTCSVYNPSHNYTWNFTTQTTTGFTITAGTSNSDTWTYVCTGY